jgi:hypothetical protein
MAIYKLFPEKDTTIYSGYSTLNTGIDQILETSTYPDPIAGSDIPQTSRFLIQFPLSDIQDIINNKISGSSWDSYLKLYLANADEIPIDYTLYCYPLSQSWKMGTGKFFNTPMTTNGCSWVFTGTSGSSPLWATSSFGNYATASYSTVHGGGVWFTGSATLNPVSSQSFNYINSKDLSFKVTNAVSLVYSGSIPNNGFIVKQQNSLEFIPTSFFNLKYFSMDTHTIYPPYLEFRWDDSSYNAPVNSIVTNENIVVTLFTNKIEYKQDSIQRFRINVRDKFPPRVFITTGSLYINNKFLPSSSYYSVVDLDTNETIIDFDDNYTKISADSSNNYFTIYMSGLEPERYYKILIKTIVGGSTLILDNNNYFKVIR